MLYLDVTWLRYLDGHGVLAVFAELLGDLFVLLV